MAKHLRLDQDDSAASEKADAQSPEVDGEATEGESDKLRRELQEARKAADTYKDQLLRKAAEFENYRRRTESDFASIIRNANENLMLALVPVLDDFERSLKAGKETADYDGFYKGVTMIQGKLSKILEAQGLESFDSVGKPFDVDLHDALLMVPREDVPAHTVVEEVERGYMVNKKVLRHAKVIVSTEPPEDADAEA
jgi:molecular chaperone GrpE